MVTNTNLLLWPPASVAAAPKPPADCSDGQVPFGVTASEEFHNVYDPSVGEPNPWYINDHTFVKNAADGTWHLFGITHEEPADPDNEHVFAHATAPELQGPWTKQPFALTLDLAYGETHLWAPYVLGVNGTYYMFYSGGGNDPADWAINLATSTDLFQWDRRTEGPLFRDGFAVRDPFVTRVGNTWAMYYTGNSEPAGGNHAVLYRTSDDLLTWSDRKIAYSDPLTGTGAGTTESPFVYEHDGQWFLFIGPRPSQDVYVGTDVFVSDDPFRFDIADRVGHINSHALEVINDGGDEFVSHCGWGQGGVFLAPLGWPEELVRCPAGDDV